MLEIFLASTRYTRTALPLFLLFWVQLFNSRKSPLASQLQKIWFSFDQILHGSHRSNMSSRQLQSRHFPTEFFRLSERALQLCPLNEVPSPTLEAHRCILRKPERVNWSRSPTVERKVKVLQWKWNGWNMKSNEIIKLFSIMYTRFKTNQVLDKYKMNYNEF